MSIKSNFAKLLQPCKRKVGEFITEEFYARAVRQIFREKNINIVEWVNLVNDYMDEKGIEDSAREKFRHELSEKFCSLRISEETFAEFCTIVKIKRASITVEVETDNHKRVIRKDVKIG